MNQNGAYASSARGQEPCSVQNNEMRRGPTAGPRIAAKLRRGRLGVMASRIAVAMVAVAASGMMPVGVRAAGVTLITHGFNGNADGWVLGMARKMPAFPTFAGTNVICYEVSVGDNNISSRRLAGGSPTNDPTAEIVIKLDWGDLAGLVGQTDTYEVAARLVPRLVQTNFIAELGGHALAEFPLHLIGHSRGGSLVCQISRLLGTNGVWVDQLTTLDPHPVNEDGNTDPLFVSDAPLRVYENVLFADNYFQEFDGYPHGQSMPRSFNRELRSLPGGYDSAHSDMHLWYHATIDLADPANDTEDTLAAADRGRWFAAEEQRGGRTGYFYSRLGGGNRLGLERPAGPGTDQPVKGFNQRWNLGAGATNNRVALAVNHGNWANPILCRLDGPTLMALAQTNAVTFSYQWARPGTSNAVAGVYLDPDNNPWNGNEQLAQEQFIAGTTATNLGQATIVFTAGAGMSPGQYSVFARLSNGARNRFLYLRERLTVVSSLAPPTLAIRRADSFQVRVDVQGVPGQRVVLFGSTELPVAGSAPWRRLTTNWLTTPLFEWVEPAADRPMQVYRAGLE